VASFSLWPRRRTFTLPATIQAEQGVPAVPLRAADELGPPGSILVVDDVAANCQLLTNLLGREGYTVRTASNGVEALVELTRTLPDLVISDVMMPGLDGFQLCERIKQDPATRLTPVVLLTGLHDREARLQGINVGADDFLTKPVDAAELIARMRSLLRLKRYTDDLDSAEAVIMSLALTIEARDPYTAGHCQRLSEYAVALGRRLHLPAEQLATLERGGVLHDVGKVGVPDSVLLKPGPLTPAEFALMQQHTVIGDRLCGELRSLRNVRPIVRHHHERLDGGGYPDGLKGDAIPLLAQILCVVDIYDAMTTARPYRPAMEPARAFMELRAQVKKGWRRADLVDELIQLLQTGSGDPTPSADSGPGLSMIGAGR